MRGEKARTVEEKNIKEKRGKEERKERKKRKRRNERKKRKERKKEKEKKEEEEEEKRKGTGPVLCRGQTWTGSEQNCATRGRCLPTLVLFYA